MTCRERSGALQRDEYSCVKCGVKQSKAIGKEVKVEVHHKKEIDWSIIDDVKSKVYHTVDDYETLCKDCHNEIHPERKPKEVIDA